MNERTIKLYPFRVTYGQEFPFQTRIVAAMDLTNALHEANLFLNYICRIEAVESDGDVIIQHVRPEDLCGHTNGQNVSRGTSADAILESA